MKKKLKTEKGISITIAVKSFASGGEGVLYKIVSPLSMKNKCAKIIFNSKLTKQREQKIAYMVNNPPKNIQSSGYRICWPEGLLYEGSTFVGFIMPLAKASAIELKMLCSNIISTKIPQVWNLKFNRKHYNYLSDRLKLCHNIARAVHVVHTTKCYVFLDLKPPNILVTSKGDVFIIDCDSIQVSNQHQKLFAGSALTMEYAPSECNSLSLIRDNISLAWDRFSMGVIFYEVLFGIHPFAASFKAPYDNATSLGAKIEQGLFVHGKAKIKLHCCPNPHNEYFHLNSEMQQLFIRSLGVSPKLRPNMNEWRQGIISQLRIKPKQTKKKKSTRL